MPRSKSKGHYGKVNAENISGAKVPRKGGLSNQIQRTVTQSMSGAPQTFGKATGGGNNLGRPDVRLQSALSGGAKPTRSGRGGTGPTLGPVG